MTVEQLVTALTAYRLPIGQEVAFQLGVSEVLTRLGVAFDRERDLGPGRGRIDFYLPELRAGLELKVKGSFSAVAEQLLRYASSAEIDALVLVTGRVRLSALPHTLGGKPLHIAAAWRGGLL